MLLDGKPNLGADEVVSIARTYFDLKVVPKQLPSYQDQNFLLETEQGKKYVLKIANADESCELLEAQCLALQHLNNHGLPVPQLIASVSGEMITKFRSQDGEEYLIRLVSYLPGNPLAEQRRHSTSLLNEIGQQAGKVSAALAEFDHPALHRYSQWDLQIAAAVIEDYLKYVEDQEISAIILEMLDGYLECSVGLLPGLRFSVVHNDLNDYNILVGCEDDLYSRNQQVVGILDFGDMLYSLTIAELAITVAYGILDKNDPLATAMEIVRGFNQVYPLNGNELAVLFDLVCMRLCVSLCLAAYKAEQLPGDDYIKISQEPIRHILPQLIKIPRRLAEAAFRKACEMDPVKDTSSNEQ